MDSFAGHGLMKKTKKHRLQRAEINFVSSLTMEQVATDIASMASERILVDIQSLDADTLTFCVQTRQNGWIHTRLQGDIAALGRRYDACCL